MPACPIVRATIGGRDDIAYRRAVAVHQWGVVPVGPHVPVRLGIGARLGYAARGITGRDAVVRGPLRPTAEQAQADADAPTSILWLVVGHICG